MTAKACFLDRDGTLIEERNYLADPALVALAPGVTEALRLLRDAGYRLIVASNQSGIARGYFTAEQLNAVEQRVGELLAEHGLSLDANYYCFHHEKGIILVDVFIRYLDTVISHPVRDIGIDGEDLLSVISAVFADLI